MPQSILFVVHAGEGVGLGHLTRSLVAANSLLSRLSVRVDFVAVGRKIDDRYAQESGVNFLVTTGPIDLVIDRLTKKYTYSAICLDLFAPSLVDGLGLVLENLRQVECQIVAIDALPGFEGLVDLLYVPSFMAPSLPEFSEFQGRLAYGWNSYLLNIRHEDRILDDSGSVLVLTGGSDVTQLGRDWPMVLNETLPVGSLVEWVTGPFSQPPRFPASSRVVFVEHVAPAGLNTLMQKAEIAITVFGVSFFELVALGVPTVVFSPYGGKDSWELKEIEKQKIALVAKDATDAAQKASMLLEDPELKVELSSNSKDVLRNYDGESFAKEVNILLGH